MDFILKLIDLCPILSKNDDIMIYIQSTEQAKGPLKLDDIPYWMLVKYVKMISYVRIEQTSDFALAIYLMDENEE